MAPKPAGKKKKKTKEELEEERRLAEEAARLAEEERLRLEEEERQRLAELERQRLEKLDVLLGAERERLEAERADLESLMGQFALERSQAEQQRKKKWEWERFLACTYIPHPLDRVALGDFVAELRSMPQPELVPETMVITQDCYKLIEECSMLQLEASQRGDDELAGLLKADVAALHDIVSNLLDQVTARMLHYADEQANEKGEIQMGHKQGDFQWAVWVNTSKNPRMKTVEMSQLNLVVEIPKSIALAIVAMRVQHRTGDEFFASCTNQYMAVGGVMYADLLTLPPPARHVKSWTLRQVTPLATHVQRIPYPIPPAGADPATYRSEEEPPPLGFTMPFTPNMLLLDAPEIKVGWWDTQTHGWSTEGISDVSHDHASGMLSFKSTHMGPLAVVQSRVRLLPYQSWSIRPTGGRNGATASITLHVGLSEPLVFDAGPGFVKFGSTAWPQLSSITGVPMQAGELLRVLSRHGVHLMPEDRDAAHAGVRPKDPETENLMCHDLALLAGSFLICRSKWNQVEGAVKDDECLVRISEVSDWEEGGRTELKHVDRVFTKEKEDGERRVLAVIRRGAKGVAFSDALDKREEYPHLIGHGSVEDVQACMETAWGEVHASLLSLLKGPSLETEEFKESPLVSRLQASPEALELVRTTNPQLTETVGQLLSLLRVFSFS